MKICERVKKRRQELKLTQLEVARRAMITQQSYQSIEAGKTKVPKKQIELAEALECDVKWLMKGNEA